VFALMIVAIHQFTSHSSALSDAGNWAAIVAAGVLVAGLVFGWFVKVSHSVHVVGERIKLGAKDEGDLSCHIGLDLLNSSSIPLRFEVTKCIGAISGVGFDLGDRGTRLLIAPLQKTDWATSAIPIAVEAFPLRVEVRYELEYGRKYPRLWWWRRRISGSYAAEIPMSATPMTVMTQWLDGPASDERVPLKLSRLFIWQARLAWRRPKREA
jgi:hypothetical protein